MKNNMKLKGFTLVETILVCVLTFMILACAFTLLAPMRNIYEETYKTKDSMDINDFVGEAVERELRYANRIYVFNGFHADDEEDFMEDCVDALRSDFLFKSNPAYPDVKNRVFGNKDLDDVVYVLKLDCRDNASDGKSRGYVSKYQFDKGVLNTVQSKINLVNPVLFDDRNNHKGYTLDYTLGVGSANGFSDIEGGIKVNKSDSGFAANQLNIGISTFKSRLVSTNLADNRSSVEANFEDTLASQVISFPLVNIVKNGSILYEDISYEPVSGGDNVTPANIAKNPGLGSLISAPRFKYYDSSSSVLPAGISANPDAQDIYFVYTLVNVPE